MRITIKNLQKKIIIRPTRIKSLARKVLAGEGLDFSGTQLSFLFVTDRFIRGLNKRFHHRDCPTDVLAFDLGAASRREVIADIVISTDTAARNARIYGTCPEYELMLYCAHGLLHIAGYDDHSPKATPLMRKKERFYVDR